MPGEVNQPQYAMKFLVIGNLVDSHPPLQSSYPAHPTLPRLPSSGLSEFFFVRALRRLGHEVSTFRQRSAAWAYVVDHARKSTGILSRQLDALTRRLGNLPADQTVRNNRLLQTVKDYQPDAVLMMADNRVIWPETLERIRQVHGCPLVLLYGKAPIVYATPLEKMCAPLYDLIAVNDAYHAHEWMDLGADRVEVLPVSACDPDFHFRRHLSASENAKYACNVGFVGTLTPEYQYRKRIEALQAISVTGLGIWSNHDVPSSLQPCYRGRVSGEDALRLLSGSRMQVNPHSNTMHYGGNRRLFEIAASGALQLTDDLPGIHEWFTPGKDIVIYQNPDHLRDLVVHYSAHPEEAQAIADSAREHVVASHTYEHRVIRLLDVLATTA